MIKTAKNGRIVPAAILLGVASLASRLMGLIRERVLTATFGAGDVFDAFVAAFRIPDLVFNLVVVGALSAAFIPLFTKKIYGKKRDEEEAFEFALAVFNSVILVVIALSLVYVIAAPQVMKLVAPGFSGEKYLLAVKLSRIMAWQPVLLGASFVLSGVLNSYKKFFVYALAPILYNVGIIFGVMVLVPVMGVKGLGWGVVLGAALHMLVQLPSAVNLGFRWRPSFKWSVGDLRVMWRMMLPRVVGMAATQVNMITVTVIGSGLVAGSIAAFHLANNVQYLPVGIFGISFAQAAFPTLAEYVAKGDKKAFKSTITRSFRYIMFLVVPTSLFLFLLRAQIVRVLFGAGAFDWEDTILTYQTFGWLIISVFAQAAVPLLARSFYVNHDTKTPVIASVISMVVNVFMAVMLAPSMGVQGLALAFSISAIVNLLILLGVLHWRLDGLDDWVVIRSMLRVTAATVVAGVAVQYLKYPVSYFVDMQRLWGVFTQLTVAFAGGVCVYIMLTWLMGSEELALLKKYMPRKATIDIKAGTETSRFGGVPE